MKRVGERDRESEDGSREGWRERRRLERESTRGFERETKIARGFDTDSKAPRRPPTLGQPTSSSRPAGLKLSASRPQALGQSASSSRPVGLKLSASRPQLSAQSASPLGQSALTIKPQPSSQT
ncbi:hypothetical protein VIGAN_06141500 [Vigna angularis var. angularis]|uniref:Uncharacterized protein n=1 Tax=Vigna angularis var. angularis TaxID=157739 RepID=A0A0S3SBG2_PHAAN|nr:hypothetical protein VIGAN_06141500 [Vigna angularis var. angularis]